MGIKLNTAKKLVINHMRFQEARFSDFLKVLFIFWKHEKDDTINPALSQSLIPYGMKRPVG